MTGGPSEPSRDWRSAASVEVLELRQRLLRSIHGFFEARGVLAVETPLLGPGNVPDPQVTGISVRRAVAGDRRTHLQTSPELAMKRLVSQHRRSIYQVCKAFRSGEEGRRHHPEFTLLEWYRVGWTTAELIAEVTELVASSCLLGAWAEPPTVRHTTYRQAFRDACGIDPLVAEPARVIEEARGRGAPEVDPEGALAFLLATVVEPAMDPRVITVVDRFPADQAALARIVTDDDGAAVSERFEVFLGGLELANGYGELTDPGEQAERFRHDAARRRELGLDDAGSQEEMLAALRHGMPDCSGVALGVDRLLMAVLGLDDIERVITFR